MYYVIVAAVSSFLSLGGGAFLGYKYGRKVEAKVQAALAKAGAVVSAVKA